MIEIQIRRPCSKPGTWRVGGHIRCRECGARTYQNNVDAIDHGLVVVWVTLAEALRMAEEEKRP